MHVRRRMAAAMLLVSALGLACVLADANGGDPGELREPERLTCRIYRIDDLFVVRRWDHRAVSLPDMPADLDPEQWRSAESDGLGGRVPGPWSRIPADVLGYMDIIQRFITGETGADVAPWQDEGGEGMIEPFTYGNTTALVVVQNAEGHRRIQAVLDAIRAGSEVGGPSVTVHARWLELDEAGAQAVLGPAAKRRVPRQVDAETLRKAGGRVCYRVTTSGTDRQTVSAAAGDLKTYVAGIEAVAAAEALDMLVGSLNQTLTGAMLACRPRLVRDHGAVVLDFLSYVNHATAIRYRPLPEMAVGKGGAPAKAEVGFPEVEFQTLRGSVRIPLDTTVLLGLTTGPKLAEGKVYALVVEVSASK